MQLRHIRTITDASPAQFEAATEDGRPVYVRFQNDWLSVEVGRRGDSSNALPGGGFVVYEELIARDDDRMTWDDVLAEIAPADFQSRLDQLEENERVYQARWKDTFGAIQKRSVSGVMLWTLSLADVVWAAPYRNRVGRFDFEQALKDYCGSGIVAYAFTNPETNNGVLTVLFTAPTADPRSAMDLAMAGVKAFGGTRFGPTGGSGRGEAEGVRAGDPEQAFAYVAESLAKA